MTFRKITNDLENIYVERFQTLDNKGLVADYRAKKLMHGHLAYIIPFNVYRKEFDKRGIDYLEVLHNPNFVPSEPVTVMSFKEYLERFCNIFITEDQETFLFSLTTSDIDYLFPGTRTYLERLCIDNDIEIPSYTENKKVYFAFYDDLLDETKEAYNSDIHREVLEKVLRKSFDAFIRFYNEDRNEV